MFRNDAVPVFRCSVFRCSVVPVFLVLLIADMKCLMYFEIDVICAVSATARVVVK